jgi:hypothetical protein
MSTSDVSICNLALQRLGSPRITQLTEDSPEARACNAAFEAIRDAELRKRAWKFSVKRATLAASAVEPDFEFGYAFPLPSDCIRLLPPNRRELDWTVENHEGAPAILTNDGDSLEVRYISRITDPTLFDPLFVKAFSFALAEQLVEALTQSNTKKASIKEDYREAISDARRMDAFEQIAAQPPSDSWNDAREDGWSGMT